MMPPVSTCSINMHACVAGCFLLAACRSCLGRRSARFCQPKARLAPTLSLLVTSDETTRRFSSLCHVCEPQDRPEPGLAGLSRSGPEQPAQGEGVKAGRLVLLCLARARVRCPHSSRLDAPWPDSALIRRGRRHRRRRRRRRRVLGLGV